MTIHEDPYYFHKRCIKIMNKLYDRIGEDPIFEEAYYMLEETEERLSRFLHVCGCPKCGEEYWCRDVGEFCPNCGIEVLKYTDLNWNIWSAETAEGWYDKIEKDYERRGDFPLKPKIRHIEKEEK